MSEIIRNMLDDIINDDHAEAQAKFNDALAMKITDTLDQHKVELAQQMGANTNDNQV
jgi:hypothetical protein